MRKSAFLMLGLACLLGLVAVYLFKGWMSRQPDPAVAENPALPISTLVVAKRPLHYGDALTEDALSEVPWPADIRPEGSFSKIDELVKGEEERIVLRSIELNEPVVATKLSGFGTRATLSARIVEGMRAVTIRANEVIGVAGFILPGDRVDVLLTREDRESAQTVNDIILQNIKVLGVDQIASDQRDDPIVARAVTLEVTPEQAQKLTLASQIGQIALALRNQASTAMAPQRAISVRDLAAAKEAAPAEPAAPRKSSPTVTVYRALNPSTVAVAPEPPSRPSQEGAPRATRHLTSHAETVAAARTLAAQP